MLKINFHLQLIKKLAEIIGASKASIVGVALFLTIQSLLLMQKSIYTATDSLQTIEIVGNIKGNNIYTYLGRVKKPQLILDDIIPIFSTGTNLSEYEQFKQAYLFLQSLTENHLVLSFYNRLIYKIIVYCIGRPSVKTYKGLKQRIKYDLEREALYPALIKNSLFYEKFDEVFLGTLSLMYHVLQKYYTVVAEKNYKNSKQSEIFKKLIDRLEDFLYSSLPTNVTENQRYKEFDNALRELQEILSIYTSAIRNTFSTIIGQPPVTDTYIRLAVKFKFASGNTLIYPFTLDFISNETIAKIVPDTLRQVYNLLAVNEYLANVFKTNQSKYESEVMTNWTVTAYVDEKEAHDIYAYYFATDEIITDIINDLKNNISKNAKWDLEKLDDEFGAIESLQDYCYYYPAETYLVEEIAERNKFTERVAHFVAKTLTKAIYYAIASELKLQYTVGTDNLESFLEFTTRNNIRLPILIDFDSLSNVSSTEVQILTAMFTILQNKLADRNSKSSYTDDGGYKTNSNSNNRTFASDDTIKILNEMWYKSISKLNSNNSANQNDGDNRYRTIVSKIFKFLIDYKFLDRMLQELKTNTKKDVIDRFYQLVKLIAVFVTGTVSNLYAAPLANISKMVNDEIKVQDLIVKFTYEYQSDIFTPLLINEFTTLLSAEERLVFLMILAQEAAEILGVSMNPSFIIFTRVPTLVEQIIKLQKNNFESLYFGLPKIAIVTAENLYQLHKASNEQNFSVQNEISSEFIYRKFLSTFKYLYLALKTLIVVDRDEISEFINVFTQNNAIDVSPNFLERCLTDLASIATGMSLAKNVNIVKPIGKQLQTYVGYLKLSEKLAENGITVNNYFTDNLLFSMNYDFITNATADITIAIFMLLDLRVVIGEEYFIRLLYYLYTYYFYPNDWQQRVSADKDLSSDAMYRLAQTMNSVLDAYINRSLKFHEGLTILLSQMINPYYFAVPFNI